MKGYERLYLCTDLSNYYEKNNWNYIGEGYSIHGDETRIYEYQMEGGVNDGHMGYSF